MTEREMLDFVHSAVEASGTTDSVAVLTETREASVRFGQNRITQNLDVLRRELKLTVGDGERRATVNSQRIEIDALGGIASQARALLKTAAVDPEYMPPVPGGQKYPLIPEAWDDLTSGCPAEPRMQAVGKVIGAAAERGYETAGICSMSSTVTALCTSTGNLAFHRYTGADFSFTMDRGLASSYRSLSGTGWGELDIDQAVRRVSREVELNEGATEPAPGEYRIILEPEATWNLIMFLPWIMDARTSDKGTSVFSGMEGKRITGGEVTISSNIHGARPGVAFDDQGRPASDVTWIEGGILKNLPCDRFTAQKTGREPYFLPGTLDIQGGKGSVEDLISGVDRGILIRRFWYIRFVDQKTMKLTGMTRDGVYLVENGRIVRPLKDFRWNWRPLELFSTIEKLGEAVRKGPGMIPPVVIGPRRYPFTDGEN